ncbi:hypothetical protein [Pseudomonas sp.]|uniref:phage baseplate plug family protein n=1 Tax=Pseudomonas sp. TaxID=306 RepID=UPI002587CE0F|nr:hypothetical protein [Pseudomonas sp.]
MTTYEIPLTAESQRFRITLSGVEYQLAIQWRNAAEAGWVLDIADSSGAAIVKGIPLVTGCDLLEQYRHLGLTGTLWVQTTSDPDAVPTFDNLGDGAHLYWWAEG